jgi:hypothetical protein
MTNLYQWFAAQPIFIQVAAGILLAMLALAALNLALLALGSIFTSRGRADQHFRDPTAAPEVRKIFWVLGGTAIVAAMILGALLAR